MILGGFDARPALPGLSAPVSVGNLATGDPDTTARDELVHMKCAGDRVALPRSSILPADMDGWPVAKPG